MLTEELRKLKDEKNMTSQEISAASGVPASTVSRILSGQTDNPSFQNICDMVIAMGGSIDQLVGIASKSEKKCDCESQNMIIKVYKERLDDKEREMAKWMRISKFLAVSFLIIVALVIGILIYDSLNPHMGYIKY